MSNLHGVSKFGFVVHNRPRTIVIQNITRKALHGASYFREAAGSGHVGLSQTIGILFLRINLACTFSLETISQNSNI